MKQKKPTKTGFEVKKSTQWLFNILSEEFDENSPKWREIHAFLKRQITDADLIKYL